MRLKFLLILNVFIQLCLLIISSYSTDQVSSRIWPFEGALEYEKVNYNHAGTNLLMYSVNSPTDEQESRFVEIASHIWDYSNKKQVESELLRLLGRMKNLVNQGLLKEQILSTLSTEEMMPFDLRSRVIYRAEDVSYDYSRVIDNIKSDFEEGVPKESLYGRWQLAKDRVIIEEYYSVRLGWVNLLELLLDNIEFQNLDIGGQSKKLASLYPQERFRIVGVSLESYDFLEFVIYSLLPILFTMGRRIYKMTILK